MEEESQNGPEMHESTLHSDIVDLQTCIAAVIASITPNDCQQCINHCQIYLQLLYLNV